MLAMLIVGICLSGTPERCENYDFHALNSGITPETCEREKETTIVPDGWTLQCITTKG